MSDNLLEITAVTVGYVPDMPIIADVSMRVARSKKTVIIGPNGAGKSTLIKVIIGLLTRSKGMIVLDGDDISDVPPDQMMRRGVAYVPQTENVFQSLTVRQNLNLVLRDHPNAADRLDDLIRQIPPLGEKLGQRAGSLSGGQRQFLAIAMALATHPKLILMDEPSAGLSPRAAEEILDYVKTLTEAGTTVLMVEQNVKQALKRADYCYVLADGRNQIDGPADRILTDPQLGRIYLGGGARASA